MKPAVLLIAALCCRGDAGETLIPSYPGYAQTERVAPDHTPRCNAPDPEDRIACTRDVRPPQ